MAKCAASTADPLMVWMTISSRSLGPKQCAGALYEQNWSQKPHWQESSVMQACTVMVSLPALKKLDSKQPNALKNLIMSMKRYGNVKRLATMWDSAASSASWKISLIWRSKSLVSNTLTFRSSEKNHDKPWHTIGLARMETPKHTRSELQDQVGENSCRGTLEGRSVGVCWR